MEIKKIRLTPIIQGKTLFDKQCVFSIEKEDIRILESWIDNRFAEINDMKYYDENNRIILTYE